MKKEYKRTNNENLLEVPISRDEWNTIFAKETDSEKAFRKMFLDAEQEGIFTLCGILPIQVHDIYETRRFLSEMDTRMYANTMEILTDEQKTCLRGLIRKLDKEACEFMGGLFKSLYEAHFVNYMAYDLYFVE